MALNIELLLALLLVASGCNRLASSSPVAGTTNGDEDYLEELVRRQFSLSPGFPAIGKRSDSAADSAKPAEPPHSASSAPADCASKQEFQQLRRTVAAIYLKMLEANLVDSRRTRLQRQLMMLLQQKQKR
ncbi:hypothetical protein BOX15_Mlig030574g1 [Macrostomum lignano]|uniref:Corticotropin-releasing factor domain-containing protein n=1 Tax=Macrostomum lignano TaxID=282301 RepID=A0A267G4K0_9PLAT|nr:hypothetical protein BOX15_Mlig030574g1 [Macrostomum lignano]